ncbi:hypothetical protein Y032_0449g1665 [Ancylostoma ceylanicum]|nr:hypothetical protein Y032_0449g1665 [Ancylostoma ceylanicum]
MVWRIDQLAMDLSRAPKKFGCSNATKYNRENASNQLRNKTCVRPKYSPCPGFFETFGMSATKFSVGAVFKASSNRFQASEDEV